MRGGPAFGEDLVIDLAGFLVGPQGAVCFCGLKLAGGVVDGEGWLPVDHRHDRLVTELVAVIGVVEVMKSFHEVTAGVDGKAIRFLVDDADAVMAGQALAEVEA